MKAKHSEMGSRDYFYVENSILAEYLILQCQHFSVLIGEGPKKEARKATGRDTGKSEIPPPRCSVVSFSEPPRIKIRHRHWKSVRSFPVRAIFFRLRACRVCGWIHRGENMAVLFHHTTPGAASTLCLSKRRKLCLPCPAVASTGRKQSVFPGPQWSFFCLVSIIYLTLFNSQGPHLKFFNISLFFNMLTQDRVSR